jgi:hypothetical protein
LPALPFGHLHDAWQRFCQQLQDGDQLWSLRIDASKDRELDFSKRYGVVEGYALLRGAKFAASFLRGWIEPRGRSGAKATDR